MARGQRGPLVQVLTRANPCWRDASWQEADTQLVAARQAPFERRPATLDDVTPPNLVDEITSIPEWQRGVKWVRDNTPRRGRLRRRHRLERS